MHSRPPVPPLPDPAADAAPAPALPVGVDPDAVYRSLFTAYPDALLLVDQAGTISLANPAAALLLGYDVQELIGLSVEALVPDSIRPRHAAYRDAYARNPRQRPMGTQMELVARRRDGTEVMVEIALSPLQQHGLPYTVAAIRGIGAYPRVKQALQRALYAEQVAQFGRLAVDARDPQELVDAVPRVAAEALKADTAMLFLLEPNGLELRVASGVGLLPGEGVGDRVPNRPDTPWGYTLTLGRAVVVDDFRQERRFAVPAADLEARFTSGVTVPLSDRGRMTGILAVLTRAAQRFGDDEVRFLDALSSLLTTSLQRAQSEDALKHSQRLESVGQLTGGIAHDFNNLLTVISGNLQVLEELPAIADDAFGQQLVGAALRASKRGAELTGKLLAFSRRQVLQPAQVDVAGLLGSLSDMLRRTLDQRIRIELDVAPDCPACLADPGQLESALLNIAINARDAMPDGGTLAFACRQVPVWPELQAELGQAGDEAYVAIAISDTGGGMPDSVKARAFEPFFTTKEAGRGTGLGLSTVYGFAKQSRGAVTLDSTPGAGTTVTLYLPRVAAGDAGALDEPEQAGIVPSGLRVLMVEDDFEVRNIVQKFLVALDCDVTCCVNAEDALAALESAGPFDLLLTDIALGAGMRGTDLAARVQQAHPGMPVLLMSGFASGLLATPPGWELLRKPYTRDDLSRAIAKVLNNR
jgi:PAS domain S-box-containing protein